LQPPKRKYTNYKELQEIRKKEKDGKMTETNAKFVLLVVSLTNHKHFTCAVACDTGTMVYVFMIKKAFSNEVS